MSFTHVVTFKWSEDDFDDQPVADALKSLVPQLVASRSTSVVPTSGSRPAATTSQSSALSMTVNTSPRIAITPSISGFMNEMIVPYLELQNRCPTGRLATSDRSRQGIGDER